MSFSGVNLQVEQRRVNFCRITHVSSLAKANEQHDGVVRMVGSLYASEKLPTHPSPKPTFCPKWEVSVNVGLGEGQVGSFPGTHNDPNDLYEGKNITG